MGYWQEVKDVVFKGVDLAIDGMKEGAAKAVEKGKEGLTYTQLKGNLFLEQRKLQGILADLGDRTRDIYRDKKDLYADTMVVEIMEKLSHAEAECKRLEEEIRKIGAEHAK